MLTYDELLEQREALAETVRALRDIVTTDHESKDQFIARVCAILAASPDDRVATLGQYKQALTRAVALPKGTLPDGHDYYTWQNNGNVVVEKK